MTETDFESEKLKRYFVGKDSEEDKSYINEVFCDSTKEEKLKHHLLQQFLELLSEDNEKKRDMDQILYRVHYEINTNSERNKAWKSASWKHWTFRLAGIVLLPIAILWGGKGYLNSNPGKETWIEIKAPAWTRAQFSLPDGTTGYLNSNSSIKYFRNFKSDRQIALKGEAFFDVVEDKKRPFKVTTDEVVVKVLGTRFNISSYENEKTVDVVLDEGKLIISDKEMNNMHTLKPNELIIYNKIRNDFTTEFVQPKKYISWTEGKLIFRNDPLDVVARRLERWYNLDVEIIGGLTDDLRLRGTFVDENPEEVLETLKRSLPIDYKIENGDLNSNETHTRKKVLITILTK